MGTTGSIWILCRGLDGYRCDEIYIRHLGGRGMHECV